MPDRYTVDAHSVVWFLEANPRLGPRAAEVLQDPSSRLLMPVTAFAEACWMVEHDKTKIPSLDRFFETIDTEHRLTILPLTDEIVRLTTTFSAELEMHDRQIVATTMLLDSKDSRVRLITKDVSITRSKLVEVIW